MQSFERWDLTLFDGLGDEVAAILSASPFIDVQRNAAICLALEGRINQLDTIIHR
jgi:hypothetical protein